MIRRILNDKLLDDNNLYGLLLANICYIMQDIEFNINFIEFISILRQFNTMEDIKRFRKFSS